MCTIQLINYLFLYMNSTAFLVLHFMFGTLMCFLIYDYKGKATEWSGSQKWIDMIFGTGAIAIAIHLLSDIDGYLLRIQLVPSTIDIIMGILITIIVLESARRLTGPSISIIAIITVIYALIGKFIPGILGNKGYSLVRIIKSIFSEHGIWGMPLSVSANTVFIFLLFGSFLSVSGADIIFKDLAVSIAGGKRGGPAKMAIIASSIFGTISGSAVANVVSTGAFTIPLMKKTGYRKEFAGAVEAVASTGGQLMPPIMGAAAFLLSEFIGMPYAKVCITAVIPALLYYIFLFFMVDVEAIKNNLRGIDKGDIPALMPILKRSAKLIIPVIVLVISLVVFHVSPVRSAIYAIVVIIVFSLFDKKDRFSYKKLVSAFVQAAKGSAQIISACCVSGIIIAMLSLTGLGLKLSNLILAFGDKNIFICLMFSMIITIILGMGLPTTAAYIISATTVAPALIKLGILPLHAHLFLFYFASISCITPPVAVASYASSAIADASPGRVGWEAVRLGLIAFIIPFAFVLNPKIISFGFSTFLEGLETYLSILSTLLAGIPLAYAIQGYVYKRINIFCRGGLLILGISMLTPYPCLFISSSVITVIFIILNKKLHQKKVILKGGF